MAGGEGSDRAFETIASAGEGFDMGRISGADAERAADDCDVLGEVGLIHFAIRPHRLEDLILGEHLAAIFDEDEQGFDDFAGEPDGLAILKDHLRGGI